MTQLGDELLIAYSDGELSTRQQEEIGCVLEHDPVTDLRLKKLQNTRQRLALLFEDILLDHSRLKVENIINLPKPGRIAPDEKKSSGKPSQKTFSSEGESSVETAQVYASASVFPSFKNQPVRSGGGTQVSDDEISGRFHQKEERAEQKADDAKSTGSRKILNLLSGITILAAGLVAGYFFQSYASPKIQEEIVPNLYAPVVNGGWTTAVINHHSLLRRDVIEAARVNQKNISLIRNQLNSALGMRIIIPNLLSHGLTFARAQVLTHNNNKIAQITYLPGQGAPVSLYLRKSKKAASLNNGSLGTVNMVHWAQDNSGFVLAGQLPHWKLIVMSVDVKRQFSEGLTQN